MLLHPNLHTFLIAARHLNFTVAARETLVSQPAITARVRKLEEELGVELFTRLPYGLRLTASGRLLYEYAQKLDAMALEAQRSVRDVAEGDEAHLYLGANRSATSYMLPRLLLNFREKHPKVRIRTEVQVCEKLLEKLSANQLDAVIIEENVDDESFHVVPLVKDEVVLICPRQHALARKGVISVAELCNQPLVTHEHNSGTRKMLAQRLNLEDKADRDLNVIMELQSSELVKEMVASGQGLGLVSRLSLAYSKPDLGLAILRVEGEPMYRWFKMVATKANVERPKVRQIIEIARLVYSEDMLFKAAGAA